MRTSNPALRDDIFRSDRRNFSDVERMTIEGTVTKTGLLLCCMLVTAFYTWSQFYQYGGNPDAVSGLMMVGLIGGLASAFATLFKNEWANITAPAYALFEGLFIGGISAIFESNYPGMVIQATGLTFGTLATLLFVYRSGMIEVTDNFRMGIVAATGAIALVYVASMILGFFGISIPLIHSSGTFGILFSVFVVVVAALNLILDFDFIQKGERYGAPKHMEWYGAFALMVTLVWLYIEVLRLLSKLRER